MATANELLARIQAKRNKPFWMDGNIGYAKMVEVYFLDKRYSKFIEDAKKERLAHPEKYGPVNWAKYEKKKN